jgi:hypothetical protein
VKSISGHYGELIFGQKRKIDILLSPMIRSLPSFLNGHVANSLSCPRVMAAPENIKAGFPKSETFFSNMASSTPHRWCAYPILWSQYLPTDPDLMDWLFGEDVRTGVIASPFDIQDVWPSSYSGNTNEILWGAKVGARLP